WWRADRSSGPAREPLTAVATWAIVPVGATEDHEGGDVSHSTEAAGAPRLTLRLRFPEDVEAGFVEYHFHQSMVYMRLALVLEIALYAVFGILDTFIVPEHARAIWLIRYAIVCPLSIGVLWLTFTSRFEPIAQPALAVVAAVAGLGIVAMV